MAYRPPGSQGNASMELIPGMDKLLNHMKGQEKTIKELKEEIKHKNEKFCEWIEENKKLKEENKKLKEDGLILKKYRVEMSAIEEITGHEVEDIVDVKDYIKKLKKTITDSLKILVDEIKKLKEWSLSTQMIEDTSAETIEEFERDVRDNWKENTEFTEEIDELKKTITRLQKERNYLGDYEGGATTEEEEEEEDEYPETLSSIDKDKFMTVFTNEDSYRIYEKDGDVAIRQNDNVRGRLIFNGEGDPDSVKFIIDSDYELKEGEMSVEYWEE